MDPRPRPSARGLQYRGMAVGAPANRASARPGTTDEGGDILTDGAHVRRLRAEAQRRRSPCPSPRRDQARGKAPGVQTQPSSRSRRSPAAHVPWPDLAPLTGARERRFAFDRQRAAALDEGGVEQPAPLPLGRGVGGHVVLALRATTARSLAALGVVAPCRGDRAHRRRARWATANAARPPSPPFGPRARLSPSYCVCNTAISVEFEPAAAGGSR